MRFVLPRCQFHLCNENLSQKNSDALFARLYLRVIAASQSTTVQLNAVAGEDEHQYNQQDRYEEDFLEAATELAHYFPHVGHQDENA